MTADSIDFHFKLKLIKPAIKQISYLGDLWLLGKHIVGIVGPRHPTEYGTLVLHKLFEHAKHYDLVTVSGMAEGIDQLCHHLSIGHNIPTIAIMPGGLQRHLQRRERHLIEQIVESGGIVISEMDLDFKPEYYSFPQRNRIIAGLGECVFLPEASRKSWSLITVDFALQMGKAVFATPNSVFSPTSEGVNHLIQEKKITAVYDPEKFLSTYFTPTAGILKQQPIPKSFNVQEKRVIDVLWQKKECWLHDLVSDSGIALGEMISLLTMLEMDRHIYQSMPGVYKRV